MQKKSSFEHVLVASDSMRQQNDGNSKNSIRGKSDVTLR